MIGTIKISLNAAHPNLALQPLFTYVGSPSNLRIIDVPKKIGNWQISTVKVNYNYPDNTSQTKQCTLVGGAYVCTIEACNQVGTSGLGYAVLADGTDENGNPVSGYVLGKGDIVVLDADAAPEVGDKAVYMHVLSAEPSTPLEGDVWKDANGNYVMWQDGEAVTFGVSMVQMAAFVDAQVSSKADAVETNNALSIRPTSTEMSAYVESQISSKADSVETNNALAIRPTNEEMSAFVGSQVSSKADSAEINAELSVRPTNVEMSAYVESQISSKANAAEMSTALSARPTKAQIDAGWWSEWTILREGVDVTSQVAQPVWDSIWDVPIVSGDTGASEPSDDENTPTLSWTASYPGPDGMEDVHYTATRHRVAAPVPTKPEDIGAQAALTFDTTPTENSTNPVTSGGIKTALDGKASTADATLTPVYSQTPTFSEWTYSASPSAAGYYYTLSYFGTTWELYETNGPTGNLVDSVYNSSENATFLNFSTAGVTATRTRTDIIGYTLGSQSDKPLQPKGDYAILSDVTSLSTSLDGKQDALTNHQLCAINSVADEQCTVVTFANGQTLVVDDVHRVSDTVRQAWENAVSSEIVGVKLGTSVWTIGADAFWGCSALVSVEAPAVTRVSYNAFIKCYALSSAIFPELKTAAPYAFWACGSLSSIYAPKLKSIGPNAFESTPLTSMTIPEDVTVVGEYAYLGTSYLSSLKFTNKTRAEISAMPDYPWGIENTNVIMPDYDVHSESVKYMKTLTQAQYDALSGSYDDEVMYLIVD